MHELQTDPDDGCRQHEVRDTPRGAKDKVIAWLVSYNRRRLHAKLGYMIPMQYEQRWLAGQLKTVNL